MKFGLNNRRNAVAHTKSAKKRLKQNAKRRLRNRFYMSTLRSAVKKYRQALEAGEIAEAEAMLPQVIRTIDKTQSKGVIKKNNASRHISRLALALNAAKQA
jgi:small subunit ribosomal protein S20